MGERFIHDFKGFSTAAELATGINATLVGTPSYSTTDGRFGGSALFCNASGRGIKLGLTTTDKVIIHQTYKFVELPSAAARILRLYQNGGADLCFQLSTLEGGALVVINAAGATVATVPGVFALDTDYVVVCEVQIGAASGTVRVWINPEGPSDTPVVDLSGIDLTDSGTGTCDAIDWTSGDNALRFYVSQVLVYDTTDTGDGLNAFIGDKRLYELTLEDDHTQGWSRSAGLDNYVLVDDPSSAVSDGDTTYVQGTSVGTGDLYECAALPTGVTGIVGVVMITEVKKTDAGSLPSDLALQVRASGGTVTQSVVSAPSTTYQERQAFFPDEPGGAGWTEAQVNAAQFGVALVAV